VDCQSVFTVPSGKNWIWNVLVPVPPRAGIAFHVRIARVGVASNHTLAAVGCGCHALQAGAHRALPCTKVVEDPKSWTGFAVPGET
jgi:hypothetical protein